MGHCQTFWKGESHKSLRAMSSGMIKNAMCRETFPSLVWARSFHNGGQTAKHLNSQFRVMPKEDKHSCLYIFTPPKNTSHLPPLHNLRVKDSQSLYQNITSDSRPAYLPSPNLTSSPSQWREKKSHLQQIDDELCVAQRSGLFSIHWHWSKSDVQSNTCYGIRLFSPSTTQKWIHSWMSATLLDS